EYVNGYEPGVDVLLRWLLQVYREAEPLAVTLATTPRGRALSVLLTHDVDFGSSVRNGLEYARSEAAQQVRATYFIQTKYVRDWNDQAFLDAAGLESLRALQAAGGEIASHSVSHTPVFAKLPVGTGSERYPGYIPFVKSRSETRDATLLGELRVSRYLLQQAVPGSRIESFRPGYLQYPFALPEALQATGYRYSSSLTAGTALSHLPYRLSHHGDGRAALPVWEFPVTLEDERMLPMDTVLLPKALEVARQLAAYGGMCVVLIHPNVLADKLRFQQAFVAKMREAGAWLGPLGEFAAWWEARDGVQVDVEAAAGRARVILRSAVPVKGLALQLPVGWRIVPGSSLAATAGVHGHWVDLPAGESVLQLEPADRP
ncbi:MAG: polysaccharide deacetylase family protein, partial [Ramlibacter sp.]|nr:polysaccharide deacetylase family protein [Ramlibacter sp.]